MLTPFMFLPPWLLDSLKKMFLGQQMNGGVADADF